MPVLSSTQRSKLEKAVIKARKLSEGGADNALKALAVHENEPYSHLDPGQRKLRNALRAKGRLLGDVLKKDGSQAIYHLSYELAYDYWHKMLFAAFLEANGLLMHPSGVAVSFEEVEELAPEEGYKNKWVAAAHYASEMLPAIFRVDDPLMMVEFSLNDRIALETLLDELDDQIFEADDALGWVYQYWQSEAKAKINESGDKIDGEKLPAVTQLFTEPYMVHYLIDNTLGAWWTVKNPGKTSPYDFEYLRTLEDGSPAAGSFDGWPETLSEITIMDPSMGSGHFLVDVFTAMAILRMHDEGLSKTEATDSVIRDNLHGLELDPRCTQLAAFNLALAAWKFCGEYRVLPEMNLACCGIAPKGKREDWISLAEAEQNPEKKTRLQGGLGRMYDLFQQAPELGSLIDPMTIEKDMYTSDFEELKPFLEKALNNENGEVGNERAVIAAGVAKAGFLLAKRYVWQITNVPYLSRGKQGKVLNEFCDKYYSKSKNDLATVFYEKMLNSTINGGTSCSVIPQNWLFLVSYKQFRKYLLEKYHWNLVFRLGANSFRTPMWDFNVMLIIITSNLADKSSEFVGFDVSEAESPQLKERQINSTDLNKVNQYEQLSNPDKRVLFENISSDSLLEKKVDFSEGLSTGDSARYIFYMWETGSTDKWQFFQRGPSLNESFTGYSNIISLDNDHELQNSKAARIQGQSVWKRKGILVNMMGDLKSSPYFGNYFDKSATVIIPKKGKDLKPICAFLYSQKYTTLVRVIDQKLYVTSATLVKVPFDLEYWQGVAEKKYPEGLPEPYSDDPTQWIFHGHPKQTEKPIQVVLARLLGYRWPAEQDEEMKLADESRELIAEIKEFDHLSDDDGIVCIPSVNAEQAAASRLRDYLKEVWGNEWNNQTINELLEKEEAKAKNLENWLRDKFFSQHCKLFNNRPFIWHIWDGHKQGFSALVNYHKLTRDNLQKLIYTYLGDWIRQCEVRLKNGQSGAEGQIAAAKKLKDKLLLILEGEPPYDIFVRWKPLEEQPIGWDPDLNDGVLLNVYPFVEAGVLRKKFNVKWTKDRGKNPEGSHWGPLRYNRYEDLDEEYKLKSDDGEVIPHLTNEIKRKAREAGKE